MVYKDYLYYLGLFPLISNGNSAKLDFKLKNVILFVF